MMSAKEISGFAGFVDYRMDRFVSDTKVTNSDKTILVSKEAENIIQNEPHAELIAELVYDVTISQKCMMIKCKEIIDDVGKSVTLQFKFRDVLLELARNIPSLTYCYHRLCVYKGEWVYEDDRWPRELWSYYIPLIANAVLWIEKNQFKRHRGWLDDDRLLQVHFLDQDGRRIIAQRRWAE